MAREHQRARVGMWAAVGGALILGILGCGGGGGGGSSAASDRFGSPEFKSYVSGRSRLEFGPSTVKRTWANMNGGPVKGSWTQTGEEILVEWEPSSNYTGRTARFKQMGPCSMAQYHLITEDGKVSEDTWIFEQKEPRCDSVQLR